MAIRCAVFDFDGTLVQSNEIKRRAFYDVTAGYAQASRHLDSILADSRAGDRYAVFRRLLEILQNECDEGALPSVEAWGVAYTDLCRMAIIHAPEVPGASETLRELSQYKVACYVNSATPEAALRDVVRGRGLEHLFAGCHGGPSSKVENLAVIRAAAGVSNNEMIVVGDSEDDAVSAKIFGCQFLGVGADSSRFESMPASLVRDLKGCANTILGFEGQLRL